MKKHLSLALAVVLLLSLMLTVTPQPQAAAKPTESRAIGIVFDNSGSMYINGRMWWSQAIYAMEVFASMLNDGDVLQIYPMHDIKIGEETYTMKKPYQINSKDQASTIRDICTLKALGTPIETIDYAAEGVAKLKQDKKYLIVLTDGDGFHTIASGTEKPLDNTVGALNARFDKYANEKLTVMYLGIGPAVTPTKAESEYFIKRKAAESTAVLSTLTEMCNIIFVRDTMKEEINGKKYLDKANKVINTDVSLKKVIVFVQGDGISGLKLSGAGVGTKVSESTTKYGIQGAKNYDSKPDTSLQGMMVTYTDCTVGETGTAKYNIEFSGKATSIEVYYEPDVDMNFIFTDISGKVVDPNALYEGDYMVSYGMKDGKTGKLVDSGLLGETKYVGTCTVTKSDGTVDTRNINATASGVEKVSLKMDDKFDAVVTVTYLNGYTITKDSTDFGWPEGGIKVAPRPAGDLRLEITNPQKSVDIQDLEAAEPITVKVFYKGEQLTGAELKKVKLSWAEDFSNAKIEEIRDADDHIKLKLHHKSAEAPQETKTGKCEFYVTASYTAAASAESTGQEQLRYEITDGAKPLQMRILLNTNYLVIKDLHKSDPIVVKFTMGDAPLTAEEFARLKDSIVVDCGKIKYELTYNEKDSSVSIQFQTSEGISKGKYPIKVSATYTDKIGRVTPVEDSVQITLGTMARWLKWLIGFIILLLLALIIWWIAHIRVLPKQVEADAEDSSLSISGLHISQDDVEFKARRSGQKLVVKVRYAGDELGVVNINNMSPGKESYLYKKTKKRSILERPENVSALGDITLVEVGEVIYKTDPNGALKPEDPEQKPYTIRNEAGIGMKGKVDINGKTKNFNASIRIKFVNK